MRPASTLAVLLLAVAVVGCATSRDETEAASLPLEGTGWQLTSYDVDGTAVDVPAEVTVTARFSGGRLSGSSGCNAYTADYTQDGDALRIGTVASTLMACPDPAASVEAAYVAALERVAAFSTDAATLALSDRAGATVLTFRQANED